MTRDNNKALPGRVDCAINFPLKETTLHIPRLPSVERAREEVLQQIRGGVLRLQGPQWVQDTQLRGPKYSRKFSDLSLDNLLSSTSIIPRDFRHTTCTTYHPKSNYHAFTRGDVITGWNHSTALTPQEKVAWQQQLDCRAQQRTLRVTQSLSRYISPTRREEEFALTQRLIKESRGVTERTMLARYGPEGAPAALAALRMKQPERLVRIRTTLADLEAVQALPEELAGRGKRGGGEGEEGEEGQDEDQMDQQ